MGDEAFSAFVEARWPRLVRAAVLLGCSPTEAEDVAQSTLLRCLVTLVEARVEPRLAAVDNFEVTTGRARFDFRADRTLTVGGEPAQRQDTRCSEGFAGVPVCDGTLRFPYLGVSFRAESSSDADTVDGSSRGSRNT